MNISDSRLINNGNRGTLQYSIDEINYSSKRGRLNDDEVEDNNNNNNNVGWSTGCPRLKGVVPQQNGHCGAQIYTKHQRIWLGTFNSEREAAMAYDSAAIKLRSGDSHRNFPWNDHTVQEPQFQSQYNAETVVSMIRNGTYPSNFATFLKTQIKNQGGGGIGIGNIGKHNLNVNNARVVKGEEEGKFSCTQLFRKELTPSDVGKLNRLVIPKKYAVAYFPCICGSSSNERHDIEVVFYDKLMRLWKFRYCYWKSSQSCVFTKGWNRFVKDKKLKAKDIIAFYTCEPSTDHQGGEGGQVFLLIDVIYNNADHCFGEEEEKKGGAKHILVNKLFCSEVEDGDEYEDQEQETHKIVDLNALHSANIAQRGLRLFGVSIN